MPDITQAYQIKQRTTAIDKIDLLLAIDDSASMGDKQKFLARAIPNLISRLVRPNCVFEGKLTGEQVVLDEASPEGRCTKGKPEFRPITDIHIGLVTSSMGNFGSPSSCDTVAGSGTTGRNLRGHLMNDERANGVKREDAGYLAYFPDSKANREKRTQADFVAPKAAYTNAEELQSAVQTLVSKVGERGCGYEAQLEAIYRFLVQPDPWNEIVVDGIQAKYSGLDREILAQRRAFLRPDSLVAIVLLTDENDSAADPLSARGLGWAYMNPSWPLQMNGIAHQSRSDDRYGRGVTAPSGTSSCSDRSGTDCLPCWAKGAENDPRCAQSLSQEDDPQNLRFYDMKRRFGVDPQFPVARYIRGFRDEKVPNRDEEHQEGVYVGEQRATCTNPLFAATLPDGSDESNAELCTREVGERERSDIFFAVIGGLPGDLADAVNLENRFGNAWSSVLGVAPERGDYTGMDVRMISAQEPRTPEALARYGYDPTRLLGNPDSLKNLDWDSKRGDLMYACTFDLPSDFQRDPTASLADSSNYDCSRYWDSPLCDKRLTKNDGSDRSLRRQTKGKAYPTPRELAVVRGLEGQGIVGSICAAKTTGDPSDPSFGYNPTMATVVDRLRIALNQECLPTPLRTSPAGEVPCLVLERLREKGPESLCDAPGAGRKIPDLDVLANYLAEAKKIDPASELAEYPICEILQRPVSSGESCSEGAPGFCYVTHEGSEAKVCPQAIVYAEGTFTIADIFRKSVVDLRCVNRSEDAPVTW